MDTHITQNIFTHYIKMFRWNSFNRLYRLDYPTMGSLGMDSYIAA